MAYIANRAVRFDRDYAIGEIIPDSVIDPKMTTKLISMGRIIRIPDEPQKAPAESAESPCGGVTGEAEEVIHEDVKDATSGESGSTEDTADTAEDTASPKEYKCAVCGKTFASANALASHSRVHKK